ncbi:MAG: NfeD family protein [Acidobacteriota bacterium]|nr:NfeD family protein [Blastocatellia bacterium]MDW8241205.1 NfeD family protein [Acidobacteriota bacterium]
MSDSLNEVCYNHRAVEVVLGGMDMEGYMPYVWFIAGIMFILAELLTSGFVLLWFGIGAIVAGGLAFLNVGLTGQIISFLVTAIALTVASRTIFERVFMRNAPGNRVRIGIESLPGQVGTVVQASQGALHEAAVKVYGSVWTAYPAPGEDPLCEGEQVEVDRVDGAVLYVRRRAASPLWQQDAHREVHNEQKY